MAKVKVRPDGELARGLGRYHAEFDRDEDGVWIVHVREVAPCHTYGDSLSRARSKVRDALALWVDDAATAEIVEVMKLPAQVDRAIKAYDDARAKLESAQTKAAERQREAVRRLRALGLSTRDAAELTGLSQQRIAQIVAEA